MRSFIIGIAVYTVMGFIVSNGKITEINTLADPARLRTLDLSAVGL